MHKLLTKQIAKASETSGEIDVGKLAQLVSAAYEELDRDRRRTDRSMGLMIQEVEASQKRLLDALDVVPEGFALFDAKDRYVLWNRQYEEMYPESRDLFAIGKRFEDVLREGLARGQFPEAAGNEEAWVAERLARHRQAQSTEVQRLAGGRWVRVEERRTADGGSIGVRVDITEFKRREASFKLLFDSNPLPMWVVDLQTLRIRSVNKAAVEHYGYSQEQFLSKSVLDFVPVEEHDAVLEHARTATHRNRNWHHIKADGSVIDISIHFKNLTYEGRSAAVVAAVDCTEARRAEAELRNTREFLDTVLENVPAAIIVKHAADFRYAFVNRAAEELLDLPRAEVIGKTSYDIFPKEAADAITARDREVLEFGPREFLDGTPLQTHGKGWQQTSTRRMLVRAADGSAQYLLTVIENITERKRAEARLIHLANHDALTDLPNRTSFNERLAAVLDQASEANGAFAVMSIDFDRFKEINDVFGYAVGDALLFEASNRLQAAADGAFIARLGGDEFVLIVADGPQPTTAEAVADRLMSAVADKIVVGGQELRVGLSIGVAIYPSDGNDVTALLANADAALYRAKAEGRGSIRFFEAEMDSQVRERRALQHDLRAALDGNDFGLFYQPQARIGGEIIGFEALLRWRHPSRGLVPPDTFIPVAEDSGLIMQLGEWTLREACREAASWKRPLQVAVNLSPAQFRHGDLPGLVHSVLLETGLQPSRLELEITESVLIGDFSRVVSILRRLKALGVRIAMDDFGTGYSSLSYLQSFPFDKIKIDRTFVANLRGNSQSAAIIRAVIGLGRSLDLPVVAEGVETEEQLNFLAGEHCDEMQGFLVGRPMPISEYAELVGRMPTRSSKLALAS